MGRAIIWRWSRPERPGEYLFREAACRMTVLRVFVHGSSENLIGEFYTEEGQMIGRASLGEISRRSQWAEI